MLQLSHISVHVIIFFLFNFPIIVFNIFFLIFTFLQHFFFPYLFISPILLQPFSLPYLFISSLLLQPFSLPYLFISPLPSTLISFFPFLFIFHYFCLFLFTPFYYKFVTISSILCIVFSHKKKVLSLSLFLSLSKFFGRFFFFLASLL